MSVLILYGSQSGTAEYFAELIYKTIKYGYNNEFIYNIVDQNGKEKLKPFGYKIYEMDSFNVEFLSYFQTIIFVCSTQGDGSEAYNMKNFWKFLRLKELKSDFFSGKKAAVYGLGDSSYDKFNYCAIKLHNRLKMLGCTMLSECSKGDIQDEDGYFTTFKPWIKTLNEHLIQGLLNEKNRDFIIETDMAIIQELYEANICNNKLITPNGYDKEIRKLDIQIHNYIGYEPGDCIGMSPYNYNYDTFMNYNFPNKQTKNTSDFKIEQLHGKYLKECCDFNFCPNPHIFLLLERCISDNQSFLINQTVDIKTILIKLRSLFEDYDFYHKYVYLPKRSFFQILQEFGIRVKIEFLLNHIPKIKKRYFTFSKLNKEYTVIATMVSIKRNHYYTQRGLCSEYIKTLTVGNKIKIVVGKSSLNVQKRKILFICTGAGVSLPWSFVNFYSNKEILIYYGFRYSNKDRLFVNDLKNGTVINNNQLKILEASSRDDKIYVQDLYKKEHPINIHDYEIYISGNSRLIKIFRNLFFDLYREKINFQSETW